MKKRGSVQVVEISFVLPVAMLVVLSLVYLSFAMFLYGHCKNLASIATTKLCEKVGEDGLYWQILGNYIDDKSLGEMMGLIGMGNNPMVGATVACAVAIEEAMK